MPIKFAFSESKAVEALAFIASEYPGLTPFYISKVLFYAEKWHLNRFGRPIIGDTYIAMPEGPVPSVVKNYIDRRFDRVSEPPHLDQSVSFDRSQRYPQMNASIFSPNLDLLSQSDRDCLKEAIDFCKGRAPDELSGLTHAEKAYRSAESNRAMDYADFIDDDNPNRDEVLTLVQENAKYGVL